MSKRRYTHIKVFEKETLEMKDAGKTKRKITEALGLEKEQTKDLSIPSPLLGINRAGLRSLSA